MQSINFVDGEITDQPILDIGEGAGFALFSRLEDEVNLAGRAFVLLQITCGGE